MSEIVDAILPAGGKLDAEFAAAAGTNVKALIKVNGKTFLDVAIEAVRGSGKIRNLIVIGGEEVQEHCKTLGVDAIAEANTGPENMFNGLDALCQASPPPDRVILVMTDLPLLQSEHLDWVLENANSGKDIYLTAVRDSNFLSAFPGCPSTFVSLVGEKLTLGGVTVIRPEAMRRSRPYFQAAFELRKSKIGLAKLLGYGFTLKFLLKRVTVQDAEDKIVSLLKCSGTPILGSPPQLAFDVDDVFDFNYTQKIVSEKQ